MLKQEPIGGGHLFIQFMVLAKGADTEMGSYSKQLVSFAYHKDCKQEDVGIYWNLKKITN